MYLSLQERDRQSKRLAEIRKDISNRLRTVSQDMQRCDFDAMIEDMMHLQYRTELRVANGL